MILIDIQTTSCCESVNATFKNLLQNSNNTLVDIFFTIEERLEEEQDNTDYLRNCICIAAIYLKYIVSQFHDKSSLRRINFSWWEGYLKL